MRIYEKRTGMTEVIRHRYLLRRRLALRLDRRNDRVDGRLEHGSNFGTVNYTELITEENKLELRVPCKGNLARVNAKAPVVVADTAEFDVVFVGDVLETAFRSPFKALDHSSEIVLRVVLRVGELRWGNINQGTMGQEMSQRTSKERFCSHVDSSRPLEET